MKNNKNKIVLSIKFNYNFLITNYNNNIINKIKIKINFVRHNKFKILKIIKIILV